MGRASLRRRWKADRLGGWGLGAGGELVGGSAGLSSDKTTDCKFLHDHFPSLVSLCLGLTLGNQDGARDTRARHPSPTKPGFLGPVPVSPQHWEVCPLWPQGLLILDRFVCICSTLLCF